MDHAQFSSIRPTTQRRRYRAQRFTIVDDAAAVGTRANGVIHKTGST